MALSAFGQNYKEELKGLTTTDRNTISFLKNLAKDNADEHQSIIVAVQQQLYAVRGLLCEREGPCERGGAARSR